MNNEQLIMNNEQKPRSGYAFIAVCESARIMNLELKIKIKNNIITQH